MLLQAGQPTTPSPFVPVIMPPQGVSPEQPLEVLFGHGDLGAADNLAPPAASFRAIAVPIIASAAASALVAGATFSAYKRTDSAMWAAAAAGASTLALLAFRAALVRTALVRAAQRAKGTV